MRRLKAFMTIALSLLLVIGLSLPAAADVVTDISDGYFNLPGNNNRPDNPNRPGSSTSSSNYYDIIIEDAANGTVDTNRTTSPSGSTITITAESAEGYMIDAISVISVDDEDINVTLLDNGEYTFTMPSADVTVIANFVRGATPDKTGVDDWLITNEHIQYLRGYNDGTFRPGRDMSRAEAAQMFYNLLRDKNVNITVAFSDVPEDSWYAQAVNSLASLGILNGTNNAFDPLRPITRAEFVTIAMNFANTSINAENIFSDVSANNWFYNDVLGAVQFGWIGGYLDETFRPNATITRAEVATITNRMLGRTADEAYIEQNKNILNQFSDVSENYWGYYHIMEATNGHDFQQTASGEAWTDLS